jgi:hypothetical protein
VLRGLLDTAGIGAEKHFKQSVSTPYQSRTVRFTVTVPLWTLKDAVFNLRERILQPIARLHFIEKLCMCTFQRNKLQTCRTRIVKL